MNLKILFSLTFFLSFANVSFSQSAFELYLKGEDKYKDVIIKEIISTDTVILKSGKKVKLIGLRAPDPPPRIDKEVERDEFGFAIHKKVDLVTPIEEQALDFVTELLKDKHVRLELGEKNENKYHHTLAYVFLLEDNTFVNTEILRNGFAFLQIRPPNMKYADQLRAAYRQARKELRGLQGE